MRVRTEYSTNYAYGKLGDVFKKCLELEYEYMPITDRYSTFGFIEWSMLCAKHDKKPIFGVELGVSNNPLDKRPTVAYFTFLAMDSIKPLNELIAYATSKDGAFLSYDDVNSVDNLIVIADNKAKLELCDPARVYVCLSNSIPIGYYRKAIELKFGFVQSSDNVFARADNKEEYRVMMGRQAYSATYNQFIETYDEWQEGLRNFVAPEDIEDAINNRHNINSECTARLQVPELPAIEAPMSLYDMCLEGMVKLGKPLNEVYRARLDRELLVIAEKNFESYFYIVAELMQWARERMIVAPGRGSSAGSLVCYLLGITSVDPLEYDLLFERFLDPTRKDLPDIDMDFDDKKQPMVFAHLEEVYGKERVAKINSVTRFKPKTIISTAGTQLKIPLWLCNKAAEELDQHSSFDDRALHTFAETFMFGEYSQKLLQEYPEVKVAFNSEYHAKNFSIHAAGAVITNGEIARYVAVDSRNDTIMADKYTSESLGLLKLDLLSVKQLSTFARTFELMGVPPTNAFLEQIPFDDEEAFDILNKGKFSALFQVGHALIKLFKQFHVTRLEDLVAVNALARPGPLMSGGAQRWVNRRLNLRDVEYAHPCLKPFLEQTYGEVVFQEQLMNIAREVGGMSIEDVASLRKAVAKSKGSEALRPYGDKFKQGAARFGFVGDAVDQFWDDLCGFGAYSFNRSHAVCYAMMTYYCCWLKAFNPVEYAAASLDAEDEPEKQIKLLRELATEGIKYIPVDPDISVDRWTVKDTDTGRVLVGPLTSIKGIGPAKLAQIIEARQTGKELPPGLAKQLREAQTPIDSLTPISTAVERCIPDLTTVNIASTPRPISQVDAGDNGAILIIGLLVGLKKKDRNDAESVARRKGKRLTGRKTIALNMTIRDDSGSDIVCIIDPDDYDNAAGAILERGGVDKAIYAVKGTVPDNFRMISIKGLRFLCNIDDGLKVLENDWFAPQVTKEDFFAPQGKTEEGLQDGQKVETISA